MGDGLAGGEDAEDAAGLLGMSVVVAPWAPSPSGAPTPHRASVAGRSLTFRTARVVLTTTRVASAADPEPRTKAHRWALARRPAGGPLPSAVGGWPSSRSVASSPGRLAEPGGVGHGAVGRRACRGATGCPRPRRHAGSMHLSAPRRGVRSTLPRAVPRGRGAAQVSRAGRTAVAGPAFGVGTAAHLVRTARLGRSHLPVGTIRRRPEANDRHAGTWARSAPYGRSADKGDGAVVPATPPRLGPPCAGSRPPGPRNGPSVAVVHLPQRSPGAVDAALHGAARGDAEAFAALYDLCSSTSTA